jgi:hypothetical protein
MNPNEIQDLVELLIEIGGSVAQAGFEIAYKQALVEGYSNVLWAIVWIAIGIVLLRQVPKTNKKAKEDEYSMWDGATWILGIAGSICLFVAPFTIHQAMGYLLVPEWRAIELLLGLLQ